MSKINPQPPTDFTGIKTAEPAKEAAGFTAVFSSVKHVFGAMPIRRGLKSLLNLNQKGGVDCPSCAWPDPDGQRSKIAEYCENGAKSIAEEATTRKVTPVFFQKYSVAELSQKSDYWLSQQGRLTHPLIVREGVQHYEKISWTDAFQLIGNQLNSLDSPDEAIFYTSGRTSNEAAFLYQLFIRMYGTNNMPDCSNMCHESSGSALGETLGLGKGSVKLEDFEKAEVIMILGQNPGTNHPRMLSALEKAKRAGTKIISVNPLVEAGLLKFKHPQEVKDVLFGGEKLTDIYLQIRINGDLALLKAFNKILFEAEKQTGEVFDKDFLINHTENYENYIKSLEKESLEQLSAECGIALEEIRAAAELLITNKKIIVCWAMGLTQHKNSVPTIREVVNLLLLKGSIGIEGGGTCPVRGHSNVQGDRTMGIFERPKAEFLNNLQKVFGFEPPRKHGYDIVEAIKAMAEGKAKVFIGLGGNFLSATPDTEFTAKALQNCDLTVHISTKLNRSHLIHGKSALILPTLGRTDLDMQAGGEQFVSVEDSMGVVHSSKGNLKPVSEHLLSEPAIVAGIAKATLKSTNLDWDKLIANYDNIRDLIEQSIAGFDNYNIRVRNDGGFYLPNPPRERKFSTDTQKAKFTINTLENIKLAEGEYLMMTIRSHDQFNTTIYGLDDRYRGIFNERRIIMMNETDMQEAKFEKYQVVNLYNNHGGIERIAEKFIVVPYNIPQKCVATYFPEANVLVPIDSFADISKTPTSKSVVIRMKPMYKNLGRVL
ncbi:oxidoreductase alpha (molybdopterin) subunit [Emticicia oligotrophica DSM 17448]|uniref:Oxidoreductase alpha (Molybdopterin) subunit n=1 Tax=Emticicia oligotrophica (strain DSM 17448 / CIP 109782 / MTCC 6937 / GPTSA100-15) TaxID=929562 RepID=A0ABM5MXC6_EMTOG|nr:FdhF/YdeP family oxidoreductase [Emticicia oligotrophica]AFK01791.1 oxidoreductase alpha (molybdopterin) subunit [Emticicia oligotrophica DSM 17448]